MKQKHFQLTRAFALILGIYMAWSTITSTQAAAQEIQPRYIVIGNFSVTLDISSSGYASCVSTVGVNDSTTTIELTMELQQFKNGTWSTIMPTPWTGEGKYEVSLNKNRQVTSGYYYRVYSTAEVYDANRNLVEDVSKVSAMVWY